MRAGKLAAMSKPDDVRRKNLRRLLSEDGVITVAADELRWLLDETSRLQQSNDRLRRQNRRLRLRHGDDADGTPQDDGEGGDQ